MGVVPHSNFKDELSNGVAVTNDILYESQGNFYINTQFGEDLVTNPGEGATPEEVLLDWWERDGHQVVRRSNQVDEKTSLLSDAHLAQLRDCLGRIHTKFQKLYGHCAVTSLRWKLNSKLPRTANWLLNKPDPGSFDQRNRI